MNLGDVASFARVHAERATRWDQVRGTNARWDLIRQIYAEEMPRILSRAKDGGICNPYFVEWDFTPIERYAWMDIRSMGLPLYPQVPAGRFFIDFADPYRKIGIELDGKDFHEESRDRARDEELWRLGWRVFRVPGRESLPGTPAVFDDEWKYRRSVDREGFRRDLAEWARTCSEGLFWSLEQYYFRRPEKPDIDLMDAAYYALDTHRLADFPIEIDPWQALQEGEDGEN